MNCVLFKKRIIIFALIIFLMLCTCTKAEETVIKSNANNSNKIALTFDDGPHPIITPKVLSLLKKYNIKATFFVIGANIDNYPEPLKQAVKNGHEIGNHTNSHRILKALSKKEILKEIEFCRKKIYDLTGYKSTLLRPPCGQFDDKLINIAKQNNDKIILWNIDTNDWSHMKTNEIIKTVSNNVKGGDIILFHDYISGEYHTIEALEKMIPMLLSKGYEFVTVSELLQN